MTGMGTGERVQGTYLGNEFAGTITDVEFADRPGVRRLRVKFDEPIDVVRGAWGSNLRRQVLVKVSDDGISVDDKGRPDGIMTIRSEEG